MLFFTQILTVIVLNLHFKSSELIKLFPLMVIVVHCLLHEIPATVTSDELPITNEQSSPVKPPLHWHMPKIHNVRIKSYVVVQIIFSLLKGEG